MMKRFEEWLLPLDQGFLVPMGRVSLFILFIAALALTLLAATARIAEMF